MGKKCQEFLSQLNDYIDGELEPEFCDEVEKYIGTCNNCRIMVDTLKQTVKLTCCGQDVQLPAHLEDRLNGLLKARWEKKFGKQA